MSKINEKIDSVKKEAKWKMTQVRDWCRNNKEAIIIFGPCLIGGLVEVCKTVTKKSTVREEKRLKENYIYDRSNGHYFETRRKPTSSDWIVIDERRRQGVPLGVILRDMKLLK